MPFFSKFSRKIIALMPTFCQENVHFIKITLLSCPYFVKKRPFSQKYIALMSFFYTFPWKTSKCQSHLVKNTRQLCQNYPILWAKKGNRLPFLSGYFTKKSLLSCQYFVKIRLFSKINALISIFCQKNVHSHKTNCCHVIFSNFSWKPPCCHAHIWSKMSFLLKLHLKNPPFSTNIQLSPTHILSKTCPFFKKILLSCHFF